MKPYLIGKGLRRIVNYYSLWKIPSKNVQVFDVVSLYAHAVLSKQPVSVRDKKWSVGQLLNMIVTESFHIKI